MQQVGSESSNSRGAIFDDFCLFLCRQQCGEVCALIGQSAQMKVVRHIPTENTQAALNLLNSFPFLICNFATLEKCKIKMSMKRNRINEGGGLCKAIS